MAPYELTVPEVGRTPVVVEVPHAGLQIPDALREDLRVTDADLRRDADLHVDRLYEGAASAGASLLRARFSRYVVDLNRSAADVDLAPSDGSSGARMPRGAVWRWTTRGAPALNRALDAQQVSERLRVYHHPYHRALAEELDGVRRAFGFAMVLAGHSMPSVSRLGSGKSRRRADVVLGSLGGTSASARMLQYVSSLFRDAGLGVSHDDPYRGGWTTAHYGRPADGVHVVQIELNRALYMDEQTCEPLAGDFTQLQALLTKLVSGLGSLRP